MIAAVLRVAHSEVLSNAAGPQAGVGLPPGTIGYIVMGVIVVPVIVLVLTAIFGSPRNMKIPGLFVAAVVVLISATVAGFALIGSLLGFVLPE